MKHKPNQWCKFVLLGSALAAVVSGGIMGREKYGYAQYHNGKGNVKYEKQMYAGAIREYNQAMGLPRQIAISYINRDSAKLQLGNYQEAVAYYKTVLQINPNYERGSKAISYTDQIVSSAGTRKIQKSSLRKYTTRRQVRTSQGRSALSGLETALRLSVKLRRVEAYQPPQRQTRRLAPKVQPQPVDYGFLFPMDGCGDQPDATVEAWYPVYVDFSQQLLTHI
jgi:tetratricopeptide (TPR) repeat protein